MNETTGGPTRDRRAGPRRARLRVAAVAAIAPLVVLAAACGSGGGSGSNATAGTSANQDLLAYARCMRSHGVPGFPDPGPNGQVPKTAVVSAFRSTSNSVAQSASKACQQLMPQGGLGPQRPQLSTSQQQQLQAQVLRAARCIRSHGVPNLPDPTVDSHGDISVGGNVNTNSPHFKSAAQACLHLIPARYRPGGGS